MKLLTIVGARPQFIKASVVSRAIACHNASKSGSAVHEVIVHTGQHFDSNMSNIFFHEMNIPAPTYNLGVGGLHHNAMTARMLERIDHVIEGEKPDALVVYGDTNSTLAGALAAVKRGVPVAHVEAGLRSFNRRMPEEINRVLTDRISRWLFCPTQRAATNLAREGIHDSDQIRVAHVGDVMYDAWLFHSRHAEPTGAIARLVDELQGNYYVATVHREENTDGPEGDRRLRQIMRAFETIAQTVPVVMPIHPRTRQVIADLSVLKSTYLLEPVGYFDMMVLLRNCCGVMTDSGGLQKEAYFAGKPCITLREETEWMELVDHGVNILVGSDLERILSAERAVRKGCFRCDRIQLYGAGDASQRIVKSLAMWN